MQFAQSLDLQERIKAEPGAVGLCSGCLLKVFAKCGDIKINHFAHYSNSECDKSKGETEWHREWKERFPERSREMRHTDENGKTRISDIRFQNHVFEFQSVLPDSEENNARRIFWEKLGYTFVWVFKKPGKFRTKKIEDGSYQAWFFSRKFDYSNLPFYIDDPEGGFILRVDSYRKITDSQGIISGRYQMRKNCDILLW